MKRVLTDGYVKLGEEKVKLSGETFGAPKYAGELISELTGGEAKVYFKETNKEIKALVKATFGDVYHPNPDGYIIEIGDEVTVYANTDRAKIYAANSLLGHYEDGIGKGLIYNCPNCEHRSARMFLPPKSEMPYYKKFIDTLSYLGCNAIVIELGGAMEFKRHPEINEYWTAYCKEYQEFNGKTYKYGQISTRIRNSNHTYNSKGDIYSHEEMRELRAYCESRGIDIIPEVPSLSHSEYILGPHPELAECQDEFYPDTCCPLNEDLYKILFDLYDEVIEVLEPKDVHIGHDEWWVMCICDKCKDREAGELYAYNVNRCYDYLASKGVGAIIWSDKLVEVQDKCGECHGAAYKKIYSTVSDKKTTLFGKEYTVYNKHWFGYPDDIEEKGGIKHEILNTVSCADLINPNVKLFDWYYEVEDDISTRGLERGMWLSYGNFNASNLHSWKKALEVGVKGYSTSSWFVSDEIHSQKWRTLFQLGYAALLAWSRELDEDDFEKNALDVIHDMYFFRNKDTLRAPHIEIIHNSDVVADKDEQMNKPYIEIDNIKMGEYIIEYEDGREEAFEILFNSNIGLDTLNFERWESKVYYCYSHDNRICYCASICDYIKEGDKVWYKIVIPAKGKVKNVKAAPISEYKDNLKVKSITVK